MRGFEILFRIEEMQICYSQDGDSAGGEDIQDLEITTQDAGEGKFYAIKTERWSFENTKEIIDLIKDFDKRLKLTTNIAKVIMEEKIAKKEKES